jgi:Na+/citrate or Na+/malate symporter
VVISVDLLNGLTILVIVGSELLFLGSFEPFLPRHFGMFAVTNFVMICFLRHLKVVGEDYLPQL